MIDMESARAACEKVLSHEFEIRITPRSDRYRIGSARVRESRRCRSFGGEDHGTLEARTVVIPETSPQSAPRPAAPRCDCAVTSAVRGGVPTIFEYQLH
jgi:hypothetical protein